MSGFASSSLTLGQMNAITKILGGPDEVLKILRGEKMVSVPDDPAPTWRREGQVTIFEPRIYTTVTSNGMSGRDWVVHFRDKGFQFDDRVQNMLLSKSFKPTRGVITEMVIQQKIFRSFGNVVPSAKMQGFSRSTMETFCLLQDKLSDKDVLDIGFTSIIATHEPVHDRLLTSYLENGVRYLDSLNGDPEAVWDFRSVGFALIVSQVETGS